MKKCLLSKVENLSFSLQPQYRLDREKGEGVATQHSKFHHSLFFNWLILLAIASAPSLSSARTGASSATSP